MRIEINRDPLTPVEIGAHRDSDSFAVPRKRVWETGHSPFK